MFVLLGTLAYGLFDSNKLFRPYCGDVYMAVPPFMFDPLEIPADDGKKNESFGILFLDDKLFVFVEPFIMATVSGFGDNERAGETGPIEFI